MHKRISFWIMLALALSCAGGLYAFATGSVAGFVKDGTGAVVPGAKITLTNTSTNVAVNATSDVNGEYQFLQLAPSMYSLVVESKGFKKTAIASVVVQVDQITRAEISLEVGSVTESVQVEAIAPLLENVKSTLSSVVDSRNISISIYDLPRLHSYHAARSYPFSRCRNRPRICLQP